MDKAEFAHIDNVKVFRPKGQDTRPKVFYRKPAFIVMHSEPSERYIMWIIYHYPYFMNTFFISDILREFGDIQANSDSQLNKYIKEIGVLRAKGYIRYNRTKVKYIITIKGYIFRFTTHPGYPLFQIGLPITVAIAIAIWVNYKPSAKERKEQSTKQTMSQPSDSVLNNLAPIDTGKVKDFSSLPVDTTTAFK